MPVGIKMLGQLRPADTTAATLYTKAQDSKVWLDQLFVCNTTAGAIACRVCVDKDGSTYDETTALYWDKSVAANDTLVVDLHAYLETDAGSVGVRTATGDALNFTLFGEELF